MSMQIEHNSRIGTVRPQERSKNAKQIQEKDVTAKAGNAKSLEKKDAFENRTENAKHLNQNAGNYRHFDPKKVTHLEQYMASQSETSSETVANTETQKQDSSQAIKSALEKNGANENELLSKAEKLAKVITDLVARVQKERGVDINYDEYYAMRLEFEKGRLGLTNDSSNQEINDAVKPSYSHDFFMQDAADIITSAADKYAAFDSDLSYWYWNDDTNFIKDTLDFFTGGKYTQENTDSFEKQLLELFKELSERMKTGEDADLYSLTSKLTIGDEDITLGQLLDFQKAAQEAYAGFYVTYDMADEAKIAQVEAARDNAIAFAQDKGALGEMFAKAISDLADKRLEYLR